jgi:Uma2 family endonuclease
MVVQPQPDRTHMSVEEYLALARSSVDAKYEYIDGQVYLLAGGSFNHSTISSNVLGLLKSRLRGGPCRAYNSDVKVRLSATKYVLPDVSVSCHPSDQGTGDIMEYPRLVVEVLFPGTRGYDRWKKSILYRGVPTIQECVLVDAEQPFVEVYRRADNKHWVIVSFGPGEQVELASLGVSFPLEAIYEDVLFSQERTDEPSV